MNIYQKKIVKEKEYIFNDDYIQTKSIFQNSKPNNDSAIKPNINIRKFYGINSNQNHKKEKNNRQHRSKSLILSNKEMIEKYIPKEIKTVLIKFNKPLDQINDIESLNHKTYYTNKFYNNNKKNIINLNNDYKTLEYSLLLNSNPNIINIDMSVENNNYNTNLYSYYIPFEEKNKLSKHTRNKSALLKKENIKFDNNSMNNSFNTIYKKSYCLDKHKNFGGNFKNKERSKTNSKLKIKINKNNNCLKNKKNLMIKNISAPNIHKIASPPDILSTLYQHSINKNKILFENLKSNNYNNTNTNKNFNINFNNNDMTNKIKRNYIRNNLSNINDKNKNIVMNMNIKDIQNNNNKKCNLEVEYYKIDEDSSYIKNKLKIKNIPPLNIQNNIQNSINPNFNDINSKDIQNKNLNNKINSTKNIDVRHIFSNKNKNSNSITFEEPLNDIYSMRNHIKNKGNLINLIDISEQDTSRDNKKDNKRKIKIDKDSNNKKGKNKSKTKIKKTNSKKINQKTKNKGKIFRINSTQKIETENNPYNINNIYKINQIKSIPLKLKYLNNMGVYNKDNHNKYINNTRKEIKHLPKISDINKNLVIINEKDLILLNDLTRIYNNNGKF